MTSSLLHFEEKTRAEKIISSYVRKSNTAWLQLYAFLCAQTGCLITCTCTVDQDHQPTEEQVHQRGDDPRHDDPKEEVSGPGLAHASRQCERIHENFSDDGQRAGMDKHQGRVADRVSGSHRVRTRRISSPDCNSWKGLSAIDGGGTQMTHPCQCTSGCRSTTGCT